MTNRKRFRILSRDGFACRYCGRKAPEIVLQVDHILARANGGSDGDTNLITSCVECNLGKMTAEVVIELPAPTPIEVKPPKPARSPKPAREKLTSPKPKRPWRYNPPGPQHCHLCKTEHICDSSRGEVIFKGADEASRDGRIRGRPCLVNPCTGQFIAFQPEPNRESSTFWLWSYDPTKPVEDLKKEADERTDWPPEFRSCYENLPVTFIVHEPLPEGATILYFDTRGRPMKKPEPRQDSGNDEQKPIQLPSHDQ